jgi:hypothetical protein
MHNREHEISNPVDTGVAGASAQRPDPEVVPGAKRRVGGIIFTSTTADADVVHYALSWLAKPGNQCKKGERTKVHGRA